MAVGTNADAPAMLLKPSEGDNTGTPAILPWSWFMFFLEASLDSESDDFARSSTEPKDLALFTVLNEIPSAPKGDGAEAKPEALKDVLDTWEC